MAKFITTSFVLALIVVVFLNGAYSIVEGEGRGNYKLGERYPNLYKSKKFGAQTDCLIWYYKCFVFPPACLLYNQFCVPKSPSTLP